MDNQKLVGDQVTSERGDQCFALQKCHWRWNQRWDSGKTAVEGDVSSTKRVVADQSRV